MAAPPPENAAILSFKLGAGPLLSFEESSSPPAFPAGFHRLPNLPGLDSLTGS